MLCQNYSLVALILQRLANLVSSTYSRSCNETLCTFKPNEYIYSINLIMDKFGCMWNLTGTNFFVIKMQIGLSCTCLSKHGFLSVLPHGKHLCLEDAITDMLFRALQDDLLAQINIII